MDGSIAKNDPDVVVGGLGEESNWPSELRADACRSVYRSNDEAITNDVIHLLISIVGCRRSFRTMESRRFTRRLSNPGIPF